MKKKHQLFKYFPTKTDFIKYMAWKMENRYIKEYQHKIKRFVKYDNSGIIFEIKLDKNRYFPTPDYCRVQSISTYKGREVIVLTISSDQFDYIVNEIEYFLRESHKPLKKGRRRFPVEIVKH
ncbi:MAG: hypothetical protein ACOC2U_02015 [bacterium]